MTSDDIAVLANPRAGRGRHRGLLPGVLERLGASGRTVRLLSAGSGEEAEKACHRAVADGIGALVAVGGDGTVHRAVPSPPTATSAPMPSATARWQAFSASSALSALSSRTLRPEAPRRSRTPGSRPRCRPRPARGLASTAMSSLVTAGGYRLPGQVMSSKRLDSGNGFDTGSGVSTGAIDSTRLPAVTGSRSSSIGEISSSSRSA